VTFLDFPVLFFLYLFLDPAPRSNRWTDFHALLPKRRVSAQEWSFWELERWNDRTTILWLWGNIPKPSKMGVNRQLQAKRQYSAPCLWNEFPTDLREPCQTQSPSLSPITHGSSSSSSSPSSRSPLASSLTRSVFHSERKTWLFGKSFPP